MDSVYKAAFDAIYPELAATYGTLYVDNFLSAILNQDGRATQELMQRDGIHPNPKGVARIVSDLGPDVLALIQLLSDDQ